MGNYTLDKIDCSLRSIRRKLKNFLITKAALRASRRSFNKWNKWCEKEIYVRGCSLCNMYDTGYDGCTNKCPLGIAGFNCTDSITSLYYKAIGEDKPGKYSRKMRDVLGRIVAVLEEKVEEKEINNNIKKQKNSKSKKGR